MGHNNLIQPVELWHPIVPIEGVPEGMDAWMLDIPKVGNLHVNLTDQPGESGIGDDKKVYVLGGELDGLEISPLTLLSKGYKILNFILTPSDSRQIIYASLRAIGLKSIFSGVFQKNDTDKNLLTPLTFWAKEPENENQKNQAREVMVMPGEDLKKIQIHFEGGDN